MQRLDRLEAVFQRELDHARVHAGGRDLSEGPRPHVGKGIYGSKAVVRIGELRMVKGVEEFGAELDRIARHRIECCKVSSAGGSWRGRELKPKCFLTSLIMPNMRRPFSRSRHSLFATIEP
jgi:hypothetical protein